VIRADLDGDRVVLEGVGYRDRDAIREVPGVKYRDDAWSCPVSWSAVRVLREIFSDRLDVGTELAGWCWREHAGRVHPAAESREMAMDPSITITGNEDLYPFKRTGVRFLRVADGAALLDEMGAGKTVQAIRTLEELDAYPTLVVAPKSAKAGWLREFTRWAPHRDVVVVGGSATKRRQTLAESHEVYVLNWEALRLHSRLAPYGSIRLSDEERTPKELNREWGAVVADEAHRAVSPKAKQTRALWAVGATAGLRLPMTGTPIHDSTDDFWSLLHFVAPKEWPSRTKFIDRYCATTWNAFGGIDVVGLRPDRVHEFRDLTEPRFLRRPKALVLPWLPEKVYERRDVEMPPKQARAYRQLKDECVADLDGGTALATDPLTILTRLTQLASSCCEITEDGSVRLCPPSSKVDALVELLEDMGDEPLVVFAQSRQLIELAFTKLASGGVTCAKIVGGLTEPVRARAEKDFADGHVRVLLLTMGAGSEALTLTTASTTCFMQRSWSLIENRQAEDRTHRPGQEAEKVTIVDLVAPGTVEEDQHAALADKGARLEEIVRDRAAVRRLL
jgi:SNF2 family DNA or RNA helicase